MATVEDVLKYLDPEEPDYESAAAKLGSEALPVLAELVSGEDTMLAAKAVSLAGVIGGSEALSVVEVAANAKQPEEVRLFAAIAAGRIGDQTERVLGRLLMDTDAGVRKHAVRAVPSKASTSLQDKLRQLASGEPDDSVRRSMELKLRELRR